MKKPKHTPGPWQATRLNERWPLELVTGSHLVTTNSELVASARDAETAHLIAAAPELLEACKALPKYVRECVEKDCTCASRIAQAAIAKAEGRGDE